MTLRSFLPLAGLVLGLVNGLPAELSAQLPVVRVGVVVDGPWERNREILDLFQSEIRTLTRDEFDVRFPEDKIAEGDWTVDGIQDALDRLLEDPEVDLVLALGTIVGDTVCRYPELRKPVIAHDSLRAVPEIYRSRRSGSSSPL